MNYPILGYRHHRWLIFWKAQTRQHRLSPSQAYSKPEDSKSSVLATILLPRLNRERLAPRYTMKTAKIMTRYAYFENYMEMSKVTTNLGHSIPSLEAKVNSSAEPLSETKAHKNGHKKESNNYEEKSCPGCFWDGCLTLGRRLYDHLFTPTTKGATDATGRPDRGSLLNDGFTPYD
ncbi:hypothetical protein R1flu_010687 [Riccia fluitans]|uniref:Uncharacterized protein n=1 Tax=Riccia fluitans TaxID=41844 RepID=A0ABD1Z6F7_9MARC